MPLHLEGDQSREGGGKKGNKEDDEGSYFFWLVKQRPRPTPPPSATKPKNASSPHNLANAISNIHTNGEERLVVWLNGGPGEAHTYSAFLMITMLAKSFLSLSSGCSSMTGMMWEMGPFTITENTNTSQGTISTLATEFLCSSSSSFLRILGGLKYSLIRNAFAWNEEAHMLFVEQPLRTGFSTAAKSTPRIRNEKHIARDFYLFLQVFSKCFL